MIYSIKDYRRAFEFKMHPPFLISQLFAEGYANTELFFLCQDAWFSCYFSLKTIEETSKLGVELYRSKSNFEQLIREFDDYQARSSNFFEKLLKSKEVSKAEAGQFVSLVKEFWDSFQKTEFIYLDAAFEYAKNDRETAENLEKFGAFKYRARDYMNLVLYTSPKYFENILRIISNQLGVSYEVVSNCSKEQLLGLFDGVMPPEGELEKKKDSQVFFKQDGQLRFLIGGESRALIAKFLEGQEAPGLELKGTPVSPGKVTGRVRLLIPNAFDDFEKLVAKIKSLEKGEIIVAETTTPEFTIAMNKTAAILTAQGGMMSHAAIVSRELKIPCIVGIPNVTRVLKDGDLVEVDADNGIVRKIN